jgi:hypothetical protein
MRIIHETSNFYQPLRAIHAGQGDSIMVQGSSDDTLVEQLQVIDDPARGALGVIAIHSTALGPAAGGAVSGTMPPMRMRPPMPCVWHAG